MNTCTARKGETLVLSSAAGATGHLAGQIAKHMGMTVIGYTGDTEKASWIKTELGFDWAFNYKASKEGNKSIRTNALLSSLPQTQDVSQTLRIAAPDGVDVFLDSVGGAFHRTVMSRMRTGGRVCIFGNLSCYEDVRGVAEQAARPFDLDIALKVYCFGKNANAG